jgi:hypothetical protein
MLAKEESWRRCRKAMHAKHADDAVRLIGHGTDQDVFVVRLGGLLLHRRSRALT